MKAARIYEEKDVRLEDVDIAEPRKNQVQIKVKYCGICGSDLHAYLEGWGLPTVAHPLTGKVVPMTLGHEFAGEVVKVGANVDDLKVGDAVAVEPLIACGKCENCRKGFYNFCNNAVAKDGAGNFLGFSDDGGFAEYANIDAFFAHKMPEGMPYELGALAEPTAVVFEAIKKSGLRAGEDVIVEGAGPIGLLTAILAKLAGANRVFVIDVSQDRLNKAKELGLKRILNPTKVDVLKEVRKECPNGVDVSFEAAGVQATFENALKLTKRTGTLQIVALFGKPLKVDMTNDVIMQGIDIITTLCYNNSYPEVLGMLNNHRELFGKLVTKKIPLSQVVEQGIKTLATEKNQVKILVSPEG
ncbi:2,3-butanediol dehydrogenase [Liquorilactobacillus hordei]|uniref:L-iditol 2-dehydrogenase n=1 Tax=Liquorilactobacillus hordei DSM 19519 TaxID=1423759 RepID=A0A0R1MGK3_9LACO|nr:2,3-butanediol dehydrogenase [Liquorilactobacillus hordei]KRL07166.1 L-iditol 2-dehydrogenase [Liquorilactobacillus hordei DSM 19519]QYH53065.1 2,3-butanediol dehydrogenase [Liquorilactobacillus hordei DSM 19519]